MCSGPERSKSPSSSSSSSSSSDSTLKAEDQTIKKDMTEPAVDSNSSFSILLELAADDDFEGFKNLLEKDDSVHHRVDPWYTRKNGSKQMVIEQRTPLMVAATYGSLNILRLILSKSDVDVNSTSGLDRPTPLHCAASGGSTNAIDVVKLLISSGADPNITDASGLRPVDVIVVSPKLSGSRNVMVELLSGNVSDSSSLSLSLTSSSPRSPSLEISPVSEKREYPIDQSLPDIKNNIYTTDEFRMYSFKIKPCSRAYSHDWTECPFVHPGENARRRDPRKFHYSCVPCPDFRKASCRRGDMCEYAHGVFECWLHPAQYRTRLCKDGTSCARRVCFFAHKTDELRPLYVAIPSPRSNSPSSPTNLSWSQSNIPTISLPGSNFQSSRLRSSINARHIIGSPNSRPMEPISPAFRQRERHYQQLRSLSSRDLIFNNNNNSNESPTNQSWSGWGSPNGKLDWSVPGSSPFQLNMEENEEPDLSWFEDSVIGAWLEKMQLDQLVA